MSGVARHEQWRSIAFDSHPCPIEADCPEMVPSSISAGSNEVEMVEERVAPHQAENWCYSGWTVCI